jgi:hypothetical protein
MSIYKTSRYNDSEITYLSIVENGDLTPVVDYVFATLGTLTWSDYVWRDGDRLEKVSQDFYSSPHSWWIIAEANPEIEDPLNIPAGRTIRVPKRA